MLPRAPCRVEDSVRWEHRGGCWELSWAYDTGMRVPESRSGAPGLVVGAVLRAGFQEGSGGRFRVVLGYVEKGVPSREYGELPEGSGKGRRNLTERLTACLTTRLTGHLTHGLTE